MHTDMVVPEAIEKKLVQSFFAKSLLLFLAAGSATIWLSKVFVQIGIKESLAALPISVIFFSIIGITIALIFTNTVMSLMGLLIMIPSYAGFAAIASLLLRLSHADLAIAVNFMAYSAFLFLLIIKPSFLHNSKSYMLLTILAGCFYASRVLWTPLFGIQPDVLDPVDIFTMVMFGIVFLSVTKEEVEYADHGWNTSIDYVCLLFFRHVILSKQPQKIFLAGRKPKRKLLNLESVVVVPSERMADGWNVSFKEGRVEYNVVVIVRRPFVVDEIHLTGERVPSQESLDQIYDLVFAKRGDKRGTITIHKLKR